MPLTVEDALQKGVAAHQMGDIQEADRYYTLILKAQPRHPDANHNMGILAIGIGKPEQALPFFKIAVEVNPAIEQFWISYIDNMIDLNKKKDAQRTLKKAIKKGVSREILKKLEQRMQQNLDKGVIPAEDPPQEQLENLLNLFNLGKHKEGLELSGELLKQFSSSAILNNFRGYGLGLLGSFDAAIVCFELALRQLSKYKTRHDSEHTLKLAILTNLGKVLKEKGDLDGALNCYNQKLVLKPNCAQTYSDVGNVQNMRGDVDAAKLCYSKSIALNPKYALVHNNLAIVLEQNNEAESALESYKKVLEIEPKHPEALTQALHLHGRFCSWASQTKSYELVPSIGISSDPVSSFSMITLEDSPSRHRLRAELYARERFKYPPLPCDSKPSVKRGRLRIGYFSADFQDHPVSHLIIRTLELHDRESFEIYAYSFGDAKDDGLRARIANTVDNFRDVHTAGDLEIAELARKDNIDIAVDLMGYTKKSRAGIFAYRAAPIQINYLGFPGTMGAEFMDYIIADPILIPDELRQHYSEKVIRLPNSYMPTDNTRGIAAAPASRAEMGLPEHGFVFCAFHNSYKITPSEFAIWIRLLLQVDGSVLWLRGGYKNAEKNLRREAEDRGVDSSRLIFAERVSSSGHLARHKLADLFLDTFIFNAHSTAVDALWAGLPVVTKMGEGFAARVSGSLLTSLGMSELVVASEQAYEALALDLATNPERLGEIKQTLSVNLLSMPLFDSEQFTKHLEFGYWEAHERYVDGQDPADINIAYSPNKNPWISQQQINGLLNLFNQKKIQETLELSRQLLERFPGTIILYNIRGAAYGELKLFAEAIASFQKVLDIKPNDANALNNMGNALRAKGELGSALDQFQMAIKITPRFAAAYNNIGSALAEQGDTRLAITNFKKALEINPSYVKAYNNLGVTMTKEGDITSALHAFEQAVELKPDYAEAYFNMSVALLEKGDLVGARDSYRQATNLKPDYPMAQAKILHVQAHLCWWTELYKGNHISSSLGLVKEHVEPFVMIALEDSPRRHRTRAALFGKNQFRYNPLPFELKPTEKRKRLRIGYFSADFQDHPVAHLISRMLELHDRDAFKIYAYSFGAEDSGSTRERLVSAVDVFRDVSKLNVSDISLLARGDNIDIAVDLMGYTKNSRTGIFAYRAAPIQINYLGFPGTMGVDFMDYIIADSILIPDEFRQHYSENVIRLPHSYMATDNTREVAGTLISRAQLGLPENGFVFCAFHSSYKITPIEFAIWMRLLLQVEGSVLWLRRCHQKAEENLRREAEDRGVDSSRLIFAERVSSSEHLMRHKLADLFLDTFIFNAHSTAVDALWAGLPVVTKLGEGFAARVAGSLLTSLGMLELVVTTEEAYEALVLDLATKPRRLEGIKQTLTENLSSAPLFDSAQFTKYLESGYRQAYERYIDGQAPADIQISL